MSNCIPAPPPSLFYHPVLSALVSYGHRKNHFYQWLDSDTLGSDKGGRVVMALTSRIWSVIAVLDVFDIFRSSNDEYPAPRTGYVLDNDGCGLWFIVHN
jgi:hypothetical protein